MNPFKHQANKRSLALDAMVIVCGVLFGVGVRAMLNPLLGDTVQFALALAAVCAVSALRGSISGMITAGVCAAWIAVPWLPPTLTGDTAWAQLLLFLVASFLIAVVSGRAAPSVTSEISEAGVRRRFYMLIAFATAIPVTFFCVVSWLNYRGTLEETRNRIQLAARIGVEHASRVIETNEVIAGSILKLLDQPVDVSSGDLHEMMRTLAEALPQVQSIWVWDRNGAPLASSLFSSLPKGLNVSDREYFRVLQAGQVQWHVTAPLVSRTTGETFFDITRRWDKAGRFAGVISVSLRPRYFTDFYRELARTEAGLALSLIREDGSIIARWPQPPNSNMRLADDSPLLQQMKQESPGGFTVGRSSLDGKQRVVAYSRAAGRPLYVAAALDQAALLRSWHIEMAALAAVTFPATLALIWLLVLAMRRTESEARTFRRLGEESQRRLMAEEALRHSQKLEALGMLTGGVAHDFNNLLMVLNNNLYLMKRGAFAAGDTRPLDAMERAIQSGTKLTRQLLAFARRQPLAPVAFNPGEAANGMRELFETLLSRSVELELHVDAAPTVHADPAEFELALINLVVNARDAISDQGRVTISVGAARGTPPELENKSYAVIHVRDNGRGIAPEIREKVFEPFFTTKPTGQGTGLGLSQVYGFCKQAGGSARIQSRPGEGTTVSMFLPATVEQVEATPSESATPDHLEARVLLVEDNRDIATTTMELLRRHGCSVIPAASADEAREILARDAARLDVVISDIVMPGDSNGIALARFVRSGWPHLGVILMTGYTSELQAAINDGFEVLAKPVSPHTLVMALLRHVRRPVQPDI